MSAAEMPLREWLYTDQVHQDREDGYHVAGYSHDLGRFIVTTPETFHGDGICSQGNTLRRCLNSAGCLGGVRTRAEGGLFERGTVLRGRRLVATVYAPKAAQ